jgi:hypothetical protein
MTLSHFAGRHLRSAARGAALPLVSAGTLISVPVTSGPSGRTAKAVVGLVLGLVAVIPLAVEVVFIARGVLYGIVDTGPYDTSWGGPTRGGAWLAHFLISLPLAVIGLFALSGLAGLYRRWVRLIDGEPGQRWVIPVTGLVVAAATALVWAWSRQV